MLSAEKIGNLLNGGATAAAIRAAIGEIESELDAYRPELDQIPARRGEAAFAANPEKEVATIRNREQSLYDAIELGEARLSRLWGRLNELTGESEAASIVNRETIADAALSPARRALAEHLLRVAAARADFTRANRPAQRLRERLGIADAQVAAAEASNTHVAVESARRISKSLRIELAECETDVRAASAALRDSLAGSNRFAMAVIAEDYDATLDRREQARKAFIAADADALGLIELALQRARPGGAVELVRDREWLHVGLAFKDAYLKATRADMAPPVEVKSAMNRWADCLDRLASDPAATATAGS